MIDNIKGRLGGDAVLEAFLTAESWEDRVLGLSKMEELPNNAFILFNGNNVTLIGDLWRRIVTIYMNAGIEHPEKRTFTIKHLRAYCEEHRQELIAAALTILRAPAPSVSWPLLAKYETWTEMVLNPIRYLIEEGIIEDCNPLSSTQKAKDDDPERESLERMLLAIYEKFGTGHFTSMEIYQEAKAIEHAIDKGEEVAEWGMYLALSSLRMEYHKSPHGIGVWLRENANHIINGRCFAKSDVRGPDNVVMWRIMETPEAAAESVEREYFKPK